MKQQLLHSKKKYTILKKRYVVLLLVLLIVAMCSNVRFISYLTRERADERTQGEDLVTWTHALLGIIADKWDANELIKRAHPILIENINASGRSLQDNFTPLSALGKLKQDNCKLVSFATSKNQPDRFGIATLSCNPTYERGSANVIIELKQDHLSSPWKVTAFTFNLLSVVQEQ